MSKRKVRTGTGAILTLCLSTAGAMAQANWALDGTLPRAVELHGVGVLEGDIFVFGGWNGPPQVASAYRYHPGGGWDESPADMPQARMEMGFATHEGHVYSVAGVLQGAGIWGYTVEVWSYDPTTNSWSDETSLTYHRADNAAVSLGGYIYTIGGHHEDTGHGFSLSRVERYDPETSNPWQLVDPLNQDDRVHSGTGEALGRENLCAVAVGGKIYAIGGTSYEAGHHAATRGDWLEVYDPATDTWDDSLPPMPTARVASACAAVGGRIYVIGGELQSGVYTDAVEYFDTSDGQWHTDTPFPFRITWASAVTVGSRIYVVGGRNSANERLDTVYAMTLSIPAVSEWGLAAMTLLVLAAGSVVLARRRTLTAH